MARPARSAASGFAAASLTYSSAPEEQRHHDRRQQGESADEQRPDGSRIVPRRPRACRAPLQLGERVAHFGLPYAHILVMHIELVEADKVSIALDLLLVRVVELGKPPLVLLGLKFQALRVATRALLQDGEAHGKVVQSTVFHGPRSACRSLQQPL